MASERSEEPPSTSAEPGRKGGGAEDRHRNGKLSIPLPFEEAVRAALEVKPTPKPPKKKGTPKKAGK